MARIGTVAFQGIEVLEIDFQVQIMGGQVAFSVVGLPDKAVAESRERVRAALHSLGLALPTKRIAVNLACESAPVPQRANVDKSEDSGADRRLKWPPIHSAELSPGGAGAVM